jgi:hypothetical protein
MKNFLKFVKIFLFIQLLPISLGMIYLTGKFVTWLFDKYSWYVSFSLCWIVFSLIASVLTYATEQDNMEYDTGPG